MQSSLSHAVGLFLIFGVIGLRCGEGLSGEVKTDGLAIKLDDNVQVIGMTVGGAVLNVAPSPLVSLCDVASGQFVPGTVLGGHLEKGLALDFGTARAKAALKIASVNGVLRFMCDVQGEDLPARGLLLRFTFPFDALGWLWHDDIQTTRPIAEDRVYENIVPLRAYADLPEWRDKPALRMGYSNRNFCTVVTGKVGLCLGVPLDKPCIFRTTYDGTTRRLEIVYDFALSPDTRRPHQANFAFDLYPCDPEWGLRDALARYYAIYPDLFRRHIREQGQWMAFNRLSQIDNANEFYFGLQEGAAEPEYDDQIGVLSTVYFTHAGMFANIPNHDPEKDPMPPYETQAAAMEAQFKKTTGIDGMYAKVGLYDAQGKLDVRKATVYGHLIAQFNLDPDLPYGEWTLKRALETLEKIRKEKNADLDGFYYDGLSTGVNYNPAHFKTADSPCLWDPVSKKPYINNFFSSCEFACAAAGILRPLGKITMMNGAEGASFFVAPWLDVFGAETGLRIRRENLNYLRSIIYHKPFLTLLKGNYEQKIGPSEIELFMKRCLAYGVFPGFFDWSPSGLGPGGRYWDHPRYYERDRHLFRKYQPLCRTLALAGWEPVTHARSSDPRVFVERFGPTPEGILWLTLLNEDPQSRKTSLTLETKALGLEAASLDAVEVLSGKPVSLSIKGDKVLAEYEVSADDVAVLQLAKPVDAARWRIQQAVETLDRGRLMRKVDAAKPPIAVHWAPSPKTYGREIVNGKTNLLFSADGQADVTARQWVMLFQNSPCEARLKVRASAVGLVGDKAARIRCRIAWVTPSFTHYENLFLDLPPGTYDWRDFELPLTCPHALRAVEVTPILSKGAKGILKIARISLSDASRSEYVIDPEFKEWYEPVPSHMRERLDSEMADLRRLLLSLAQQPTGPEAQERLYDISAKCAAIRHFIANEKVENGCRRILRDLETIEKHMGAVALSAFRIAPPVIRGAATAAPGDAVKLVLDAPSIEGVPAAVELRSTAPMSEGILRIPSDAPIGSTVEVSGFVRLGAEGRQVVMSTAHKVTILAPIEMTLKSEGTNPETGAARLRILLRNNRVRPVNVGLSVSAPEGWQVTAPTNVEVPAQGDASVEAQIAPTGTAQAGSIEVSAAAAAGADRAAARLAILVIPKEANLIRNPGFEEGLAEWHVLGGAGMDSAIAHSGKASLRLVNLVKSDSQASQSLMLNQKAPCAILVRASSKARDVSGSPGKGYSLYIDVYYTDGTPLYGRTFEFQTGTTEWQLGELYIEPEKPIRNVNTYLLLRGKSGTAWFDDVAVMEDLRRKGNIAREAQVSVDSNFSGYDPSPISDGVIQGEGLHWTKEAWASAENEEDHFIVLTFGQPKTIARAVIYWSLDAGIPRASQEVYLQVPQGDGWRTVATVRPSSPTPQTEISLEQPVKAERLRLFQPRGKGPLGRKNLMWVREVEVFSVK